MSDSWSEAGFLQGEAHDWREAGFEPNEAADWRDHGFELGIAESWKDNGFELEEAIQWTEAGVSPDIAKTWYEAAITPEEAARWVAISTLGENLGNEPEIWWSAGFSNIDEAEEWARGDFSAREAAELREAGLSVAEAIDLRGGVEDETLVLTDYQLSWLDGLRAFVAFMGDHPELIPTEGSGLDLVTSAAYGYGTWGSREGVAKICASWARALGHAEKDYSSLILSILAEPGRFGPHRVGTYASRAMVCEARVVEREVTAEVPDPELVAKVPTVTVTSVCRDVVYECPPILAGAADHDKEAR